MIGNIKQNFRLIKENGKGGPLNVFKFRKNNNNFTCKKKKHFNKYRINTKNKKKLEEFILIKKGGKEGPLEVN